MWLGTIVMLAAAAGEDFGGGLVIDPNNPNVVYAEAQEALVVRGTLVEPALPFGLATVVLNNADVADGASLVVTVVDSDDGVPSLTTVEIGEGADFDNDGDVDGRDFLVWQRGVSPAAKGDADVDGNDYLLWQRQIGVQVAVGDLADWQTNFGSTYAAIDAEAWLSAALPAVDDEALLAPPKALDFVGFEIEQDGKIRGAVLWELRTTPKGATEVVTHLWATVAFEPLAEAGDTVTLIPVGPAESIPWFHDQYLPVLASDPIATYEQGSEIVSKTKVKPVLVVR